MPRKPETTSITFECPFCTGEVEITAEVDDGEAQLETVAGKCENGCALDSLLMQLKITVELLANDRDRAREKLEQAEEERSWIGTTDEERNQHG